MGNIFKVFEDLIDPRLIYMDEGLSNDEIKKCIDFLFYFKSRKD
jgi:hypothetical protein